MGIKVAAVFGTRPEAIKLAPVCRMLADATDIVYCGIDTGQHQHLMPPIMDRFGVPPAISLNLMTPGQTLIELESRMLKELSAVFRRESPDVVMVQGDTATAVMAAWAAFHEGFAVAHVEAGLRTYRPQSPFPEETFRRAIATFSRWNFAPSVTAAQNLLREAVPGKIVVTGNPVVDALAQILRWGLPSKTYFPIKEKAFRIIATIHRRENHPYLPDILGALDALARHPYVELFFPLHPNPAIVQTVHRLWNESPVHIIEPLEYEAWIHFMQTADLIISDSGGVQEEAPILGVPLLVAREETERPEVITEGYGLLVGHDRDTIVTTAIKILRGQVRFKQGSPYGDGKAARRIVYYLLHPNAPVDGLSM